MRKWYIALAFASFIIPVRASELTYDKFSPSIEYRHTTSDNETARKFLAEIEKIPDHIQQLIEERGGKIVFFNGSLTDNPEFHKHKGKHPPGWDTKYIWNDFSAGYSLPTKTVFLGVHRTKYEMRDPSLHEYGHCFDFVIGEYLYNTPISKIPAISDIIQREPFNYSYLNRPREYIANSFEQFYRGEETKKSLKENQPVIHKFLSNIESRIINAQKIQTKTSSQNYTRRNNYQRGFRLFRRR